MIYREAIVEDIPQIQIVRHSVKENVLSNPDLVTDQDCVEYLTRRGKGWVCVVEEVAVGFSIVDLQDNNVWALFIQPEFEGKGLGRQLHKLLLNWYFTQTSDSIWLGTDPGTRAEGFYKKMGWTQIGFCDNGEAKFQMTAREWQEFSEDYH